MNEPIVNKVTHPDIILNLNIDDSGFKFTTSIEEAIERAKNELTVLNETVESIRELDPNCDKLDYILAASSGGLCSLIDIFLVGKPGESTFGKLSDEWFTNRTMDFAKMCHPKNKDFTDLSSAIRFLEEKFKIPYDQTGLHGASRNIYNLTPGNHHFKSLAHNPSLFGLFFSILDQFTNQSHFVTEGELIALQKAKEGWELQGSNLPSRFFCGVVNWIGHLMSDITGSSTSVLKTNRGMGIPSPFWTWTNDIVAIKRQLNLSVTEVDKTLNELAVNIFDKGYDVRFQATQVIPVFINEMVVRFVYSVRRLFKYFSETKKEDRSFSLMWQRCEPFSNATVKRMLTVAHGTFCLFDAGDAALSAFRAGGGNFNPVEFLLRLNVAGVGRFSVSLYGETKRAFSYHSAKRETTFALKESVIVKTYIEGLKVLSVRYDDDSLMTFIADFEKSNVYAEAFRKSVKLAELREVSSENILTNKAEIDRYFIGN